MSADRQTGPPARRTLPALGLHERLRDALRHGVSDGRVHSIFRHVINLELDGGLIALTGRDHEPAPMTARLDLGRLDGLGLAPGDAVQMKGDAILLGDALRVSWANAECWQLQLPTYTPAPGFRSRVSQARRMLARQRPEPPDGALAKTVDRALRRHECALVDALAAADITEARRHAQALVGLGHGLTPAGDDLLVGLFAVLNLPGGPGRGQLAGGRAVLDHAAHATNAISFAALHAAAGGEVRASLSHLIGVLLRGPESAIAARMRQVMTIGSTSGADMAAGVLSGLELCLRLSDA